MARKDQKRQPQSLTPLERKLISERDKKMGIFRKTKKIEKKPEKKTRVAEFEFKPGQIIQMPRQAGKSQLQYGIFKELHERGLPMPEFRAEYTPRGYNPFGDWHKPVDDAKLDFICELIHKKHGVRVEIDQRTNGDYVMVFMRGRPESLKIARTALHTIDPSKIIGMIEKHFHLSGSQVQTQEVKSVNKVSPTETWAEKWARENQ